MPKRSSLLNRFALPGLTATRRRPPLEQTRCTLEDVEVPVRRRVEGAGQHDLEHAPRIGCDRIVSRPRGFVFDTPPAGYTMKRWRRETPVSPPWGGRRAFVRLRTGDPVPRNRRAMPLPPRRAPGTAARPRLPPGGEEPAEEFVVTERSTRRPSRRSRRSSPS